MNSSDDFRSELAAAKRSQNWPECVRICRTWVATVTPDDFESWYGSRICLADYLQEVGREPETVAGPYIEEARSLYEEALPRSSKQATPEKWSSTHRNLGEVYREREEGDRRENLQRAIQHYEKSMAIITRGKDPELWASIKAAVAICYVKMSPHLSEDEVQESLSCVTEAHSVFTKEEFPEEYEELAVYVEWLEDALRDLRGRS
jgi:tetratricopeptide (TPR) repeat protein